MAVKFMNADPRATTVTRPRYRRIVPSPRYGGTCRETVSALAFLPVVKDTGTNGDRSGRGAGKNMLRYPDGVDITESDFSSGILDRTRNRALKLNIDSDLMLRNAQSLYFPDGAFDEVVEILFSARTQIHCWVSGYNFNSPHRQSALMQPPENGVRLRDRKEVLATKLQRLVLIVLSLLFIESQSTEHSSVSRQNGVSVDIGGVSL
jgi:hypothetical protein